MVGVSPDGWMPDVNEEQARMVADILIERGYGVRELSFDFDGEVLGSFPFIVELVNIRSDNIFQGYGGTFAEAFMNAFIEYQNFNT